MTSTDNSDEARGLAMLLAFFLLLLSIPAGAAMLMIGLAAFHDLWPGIPAAGYWTCFGIQIGLIYVFRWLLNYNTNHRSS